MRQRFNASECEILKGDPQATEAQCLYRVIGERHEEFEQVLWPDLMDSGSLVPAILNRFSRWHPTGQHQMTLVGLSSETML